MYAGHACWEGGGGVRYVGPRDEGQSNRLILMYIIVSTGPLVTHM